MKTKTLLLVLVGLICGYSAIHAQIGSELLRNTNFGTTDDGVTGVNTTTPLYKFPSWQSFPSNWTPYYQPPTSAFYNVYWADPSAEPINISINPAVTIAPPLNSPETQYIFGFNEQWYSNYYTFVGNDGKPTGLQIMMAPNNGYYVIGTSTQGMYNAPTLTVGSAAWHVLYDRYEVNQANPANYFLIVNADQNKEKIFYQQNVTVTPGAIYRMSADVARLNIGNDPGSAPNVAFNINGANVFNTGYITNGGEWNTYTFDYIAPCDATTIPIAFSNNTNATNGNDLALDNLSFKAIIPQITMTTVGDCDNLPVTITSTAAIDVETPSNYTITWYNGSTSLSGGNLATNSTHLVTITNCSDAH